VFIWGNTNERSIKILYGTEADMNKKTLIRISKKGPYVVTGLENIWN